MRVTIGALVLPACVHEGFEGELLLLGRASETTVSEATDTADAAEVTRRAVDVTCAVSLGRGRLTFYDAHGAVDAAAVAAAASGDSLHVVGWCVVRTAAPLAPSLRDAAVHASLEAAQGGGPPLVLLLVSTSLPAGASTQNIEYVTRRMLLLLPRPLAAAATIPLQLLHQHHHSLDHLASQVLLRHPRPRRRRHLHHAQARLRAARPRHRKPAARLGRRVRGGPAAAAPRPRQRRRGRGACARGGS